MEYTKNDIKKMRDALMVQGYDTDGMEKEDVIQCYNSMMYDQTMSGTEAAATEETPVQETVEEVEAEEVVKTPEETVVEEVPTESIPEVPAEETVAPVDKRVQGLMKVFKGMLSTMTIEEVKTLGILKQEELNAILDAYNVVVDRNNADEVYSAIHGIVYPATKATKAPEVPETKVEAPEIPVPEQTTSETPVEQPPVETVENVPEIPAEQAATTVATKEELNKLTATQLVNKLGELGVKASKNKGKTKLVDMLFEALQPAGAVAEAEGTPEVPMEPANKDSKKPAKKTDDKAAKKQVEKTSKDNGPKMPYISKADLASYIVWKQLDAKKLARKDYVNVDVMNDYVAQKLFYNKELKQRVDYDKMDDMQKAHVAKAIGMLVEDGTIKYVESVDRFRANGESNERYANFATRKGYIINPRYICRYCFSKGEDAVFTIDGRKVIIDFKSMKFANITDKDKYIVRDMLDVHWDALNKEGKFIGMYNRKTNAYTDFFKTAEEAQKAAKEAKEKKQVVPQNITTPTGATGDVPPAPAKQQAPQQNQQVPPAPAQPGAIGGDNVTHQVQ